jgi:hypothetical protein
MPRREKIFFWGKSSRETHAESNNFKVNKLNCLKNIKYWTLILLALVLVLESFFNLKGVIINYDVMKKGFS